MSRIFRLCPVIPPPGPAAISGSARGETFRSAGELKPEIGARAQERKSGRLMKGGPPFP